MSARRCFSLKIASGRVSARAGTQIMAMLDKFEAEYQARLGDGAGQRQAALDAAQWAKSEASRKADEARSALIAQTRVIQAVNTYADKVAALRATEGEFGFGNKAPPSLGKETQTSLGFSTRSLLARDPWEIATWNNVYYLARQLRGEADRLFAEGIEFLRPKGLGFVTETARELDVLRAVYGRTDVNADAQAVAKAWHKTNAEGTKQYRAAGGQLEPKESYFPNPSFDPDKVKALGPQRFRALVDEHADRSKMIDFALQKPLSDTRYNQLVEEAYQTIITHGLEEPASGKYRGQRMLANARDYPRLFEWKSAESWQAIAEAMGTHASPYDAMRQHMTSLANDTALMRVLGRNPEGTKKFILDLFDREGARLKVTAENDTPEAIAKAAKINQGIDSRVARERKQFENLYAEVTGLNRIPVSTTMAQGMADVRAALVASQMGSALIASFGDAGSLLMTARFNGIPATNVLTRATAMMGEKGSEIFAAQQGLVADSLAHVVGQTDQVIGENLRSGRVQKAAGAVIRASGLRRWTAVLRAAFGLEMMAHVAREQSKTFAELTHEFRNTLGRYGIGESDWNLIRATPAFEPRPQAFLLRPADVIAGGTPAHQVVSEKLSRLVNTEMDYAVIDNDPVTRAMIYGESRPGTFAGEAIRAVSMYRGFPTTFLTMHWSRAFARGWDGSRLAHAGLAMVAMTLLGALSMQAKEIISGRDPHSLDPTTAKGLRAWGKAMIQGGGLGVFGDVLAMDQTRHGNTWAATLGGPVAGVAETVLGDFVIKNIQHAAKGEPSHFAGDALYAGARYVPGASLWYARLAFQRAVVDQAALMIDSRAPERFRRLEREQRKSWDQEDWWRRGRPAPDRAPGFQAMMGVR